MLVVAFTLGLASPPVAPVVELPPPRRGNTILQGTRPNPRYGVAASLRIPVLVGEAARLAAPPVGFGFGLQLRLHPWRVGQAHLGFAAFGGHLRVPTVVEVIDAEQPEAGLQRRQQSITHTDFAAGISFHVPAGPVVLGLDLGAGLAISTFTRPTDVRPEFDEWVTGTDPLLRGGVLVFVPVRNNHGPALTVAGVHPFSGDRVVLGDVSVRPFTTVLDASVGYMAFF